MPFTLISRVTELDAEIKPIAQNHCVAERLQQFRVVGSITVIAHHGRGGRWLSDLKPESRGAYAEFALTRFAIKFDDRMNIV